MSLSHNIIQYRKNLDYNKVQDLLRKKIDNVNSFRNVDGKLENFNKVLLNSLNYAAPIVTKRVKHQSQPPWFSSFISKAIVQRERAKGKKQLQDYRILRNKVSCLIRQHKRDYYARVFKECSVNTSKLWKVFNEITGHKNVNLSVNSLVINDVIINDETQIVNNFNQYFISIPLTLKNTLLNVDYVITDKFLQFISLKEIKNNGFTIPLITKSQVTRWLHTLDKHKATGCDNLSATYLHSVGPVIVNTL